MYSQSTAEEKLKARSKAQMRGISKKKQTAKKQLRRAGSMGPAGYQLEHCSFFINPQSGTQFQSSRLIREALLRRRSLKERLLNALAEVRDVVRKIQEQERKPADMQEHTGAYGGAAVAAAAASTAAAAAATAATAPAAVAAADAGASDAGAAGPSHNHTVPPSKAGAGSEHGRGRGRQRRAEMAAGGAAAAAGAAALAAAAGSGALLLGSAAAAGAPAAAPPAAAAAAAAVADADADAPNAGAGVAGPSYNRTVPPSKAGAGGGLRRGRRRGAEPAAGGAVAAADGAALAAAASLEALLVSSAAAAGAPAAAPPAAAAPVVAVADADADAPDAGAGAAGPSYNHTVPPSKAGAGAVLRRGTRRGAEPAAGGAVAAADGAALAAVASLEALLLSSAAAAGAPAAAPPAAAAPVVAVADADADAPDAGAGAAGPSYNHTVPPSKAGAGGGLRRGRRRGVVAAAAVEEPPTYIGSSDDDAHDAGHISNRTRGKITTWPRLVHLALGGDLPAVVVDDGAAVRAQLSRADVQRALKAAGILGMKKEAEAFANDELMQCVALWWWETARRSKQLNILPVNSQATAKLAAGEAAEIIARPGTRAWFKYDTSRAATDYDTWLLPVNNPGVHWWLLVVKRAGKKGTIVVYDSSSGPSSVQDLASVHEETKALRYPHHVAAINGVKGQAVFAGVAAWRLEFPPVPQQLNGYTCGYYVAEFGRRIAMGEAVGSSAVSVADVVQGMIESMLSYNITRFSG
ncbi:hypothetical protein HYH02_010997 [Chlamydomonas schloesseri]|uniref:Ubiquitin-like protease family profile domain-containing protein n=1 Tax=Chlamydomonas schloesseri TaxID=2026947 RepID=A0A835TGI6_9CHLO|nr:hypothetical protein HYH02_010997 [Chlamydomonas schloesseri]|eukprot:KAG2438300.1 hypothetical protein HYH02_010997 [Chlamydomonas schloesseri]